MLMGLGAVPGAAPAPAAEPDKKLWMGVPAEAAAAILRARAEAQRQESLLEVWYASDAAYAEVLSMRKAAGMPLHPKSNLAARRRAAAAAAPAAAAAALLSAAA